MRKLTAVWVPCSVEIGIFCVVFEFFECLESYAASLCNLLRDHAKTILGWIEPIITQLLSSNFVWWYVTCNSLRGICKKLEYVKTLWNLLMEENRLIASWSCWWVQICSLGCDCTFDPGTGTREGQPVVPGAETLFEGVWFLVFEGNFDRFLYSEKVIMWL